MRVAESKLGRARAPRPGTRSEGVESRPSSALGPGLEPESGLDAELVPTQGVTRGAGIAGWLGCQLTVSPTHRYRVQDLARAESLLYKLNSFEKQGKHFNCGVCAKDSRIQLGVSRSLNLVRRLRAMLRIGESQDYNLISLLLEGC